jgi:hypothetical protein
MEGLSVLENKFRNKYLESEKEGKRKETHRQRTELRRKLQAQKEEIKFRSHCEVSLGSLVSVPPS